ncbi:50S ribosomal protein L11 methyltransferase [Caldivirga maquilingensis]|uniref:tRNA (guanine(26)-N(2))-dimethyltransferase n=1 Tax=Caldivirga maquilingensis (strain ATCC 700844 / DSM 13496 / JCM 10307 / IC-167) TaxID=397948 RepID=A8M8R7_CALMQ|nr:tRNA (guanine(26)-N(2))-dimethyltransferase [Caldivirga maquilingensis]ABW02136.1 tRNA (guanine-N(2)-)-methyltransferase [Caldivirga maquilingensis IC-167]
MYVIQREGAVSFYAPDLSKYIAGGRIEPAWAPVFYNPAMANNRSISVIIVRAYLRLLGRNGVLCEPFTGTGVRSIRYVKEAGVEKVIAGDIDDAAVNLASRNVELNGLRDQIKVTRSDANALLANNKCDIIDVDPYGSPAPFINSALLSIKHGGLLCATATDLAVLQGSYVNKAIRRYGFRPLRGFLSREIGLRGLLGFIARQALVIDAGVKPLLAYWERHYYRVCLIVSKDRGTARETAGNLGYAYYCSESLRRGFIKGYPIGVKGECAVSGPLWIGAIGDVEFLDYSLSLINNTDYELKAAEIIKGTLPDNLPIPLYYTVTELGRGLGFVPSPLRLRAYLMENGIEAYGTHFTTDGVKTNAEPWRLIRIIHSIPLTNN